MKKISIFIDHDIIFRNFIFTNAFQYLDDDKDNFEIDYVIPELGNKRFTTNPYEYIPVNKIKIVKEFSIRKKYWRYLLYLSVMRPSFNKRLSNLRKFRVFTLGKKATIIFTFLSLPIIRGLITSIIKHFLMRNRYTDLENYFNVFKPDIVLHPTVLDGIYCNDLALLSKKYNYKTVFIINSWDNPSSKNILYNSPDYLLVWGNQTKKHAINFTGMEEKKVIKFGANQFENIKKITRKKLTHESFKKYNKKILFAGSNAGVDEFKCLDELENILKVNISSYKIVYRPHPWSSGGIKGERFRQQKWKNIIIDSASKNFLKTLGTVQKKINLPKQNDTYSAISKSNIVISPLSTIMIETILSGRVAVAFIPKERDNPLFNKVFLNLDYLTEMLDEGFLPVCRTSNDIFKVINNLENYDEYRLCLEKQIKHIDYYVSKFEESWPSRFKKFINDC